jgi:Cu+-exporting ATPase
MIVISDPLKPDAKHMIEILKSRGITPYMITGDQEETARYIANQLSIEHIYFDVLPHEKAEIIQKIREEKQVVAFVGDGINDAPALKMADVGFAVGSGSDIAIDTSDVTLMSTDLKLVIDAIDLSLATLKNIYLNFFWAFAYNIVMIPLAAFGYLNPSLAGIGMGFSSIMVVLNALSLKRFKFKTEGGKS